MSSEVNISFQTDKLTIEIFESILYSKMNFIFRCGQTCVHIIFHHLSIIRICMLIVPQNHCCCCPTFWTSDYIKSVFPDSMKIRIDTSFSLLCVKSVIDHFLLLFLYSYKINCKCKIIWNINLLIKEISSIFYKGYKNALKWWGKPFRNFLANGNLHYSIFALSNFEVYYHLKCF